MEHRNSTSPNKRPVIFKPYRTHHQQSQQSRHNVTHRNHSNGTSRSGSRHNPNVNPVESHCVRSRSLDVPRFNPLPKDWLHLSPVGNPIAEVPFICFKTPFDSISSYPLHLRSEAFSTKRLLEELDKKSVRLGLVIDLTDTHRYYEPSSLICKGIPVVKLRVPGKGVPTLECYRRFHAEVSKCMQHCLENQKKIGVHCTHGINRTGWFICRFLMDELRFTADEAIRIFGEARGHHIYREYILEDLKRYESTPQIVKNVVGNAQDEIYAEN